MRPFHPTVQIRHIILALTLIFSPLAAAGICEWRMVIRTNDSIQDRIRQKIFRQRPYALFLERATDKALVRLGLEAIGLENGIVHLALRARALNQVAPFEVKLRTTAAGTQSVSGSLYFPDRHPTVWQLTSAPDLIEDQNLFSNPFVADSRRVQKLMSVGFTGDPDPEGTRVFTEMNWLGRLTLGLEVPCGNLSEYVTDVVTSDANGVAIVGNNSSNRFCRVIIAHTL